MPTNHLDPHMTALAARTAAAFRAEAPTRPTHVSHPTIAAMVDEMRATCRDELVHYAGASYRDDVAWQVCLAWLASPNAAESELKATARNAAGWGR